MTKKNTLLFFEDRKGHRHPSSDTPTLSNDLSLPTLSLNSIPSRQQLHPPSEPSLSTNVPKPKWHDEDDDHLKIDLLQFNRLKKLRHTENEQFISGTEYSQRLASLRAFQKYNPTTTTTTTDAITHPHTPAWAIAPSVKRAALEKKQQAKKKKQKSSHSLDSFHGFKSKENDEEEFSEPDVPLPFNHHPSKKNHTKDRNDPLFYQDEKGSFEDEDEEENEDETTMISNLIGEANPDMASLLRSTAPIIERPTTLLSPEALHLIRVPNVQHTHDSVVTSLRFHPNCNMLLSTGRDKTLRLAHINARDNPTLAQIRFKDLALMSSAVHPSGEYVYLTGKKTYWYTYNFVSGFVSRIAAFPHKEDLLPSMEHFELSPSGKYICFVGAFGHLILVDGHSKKWITQFKQNGPTRCVAWASDDLLMSLGEDGFMYVWDIRSRRCLAKWSDHENYKPGALAFSSTSSWMATGSYSGIVNVYQSSNLGSHSSMDPNMLSSQLQNAKLHHSIGNLVTPIRGLRFNHDAQLLCMWSRFKKDQLKVVHLPTARVFHNWPTQRTPLSYVQTMDFSPHSSLMAIGNEKGRILLYKLKHYEHY